MSYDRDTNWNNDPNNFSNPGGPDAGFGGQQQQPGTSLMLPSAVVSSRTQTRPNSALTAGDQWSDRPTRDPTDTSRFASDQSGGRQGQGQGQGQWERDNNWGGSGVGGGGYDRAGRGSDTLGDQYQTSAGAGDNYGSTGYPGNTTGTDSYGAGDVNQYPRSGAGGAYDNQDTSQFSGGGTGGGRGFGDNDDYDQSQYQQGAGAGHERSTGQKIKGEYLTQRGVPRIVNRRSSRHFEEGPLNSVEPVASA